MLLVRLSFLGWSRSSWRRGVVWERRVRRRAACLRHGSASLSPTPGEREGRTSTRARGSRAGLVAGRQVDTRAAAELDWWARGAKPSSNTSTTRVDSSADTHTARQVALASTAGYPHPPPPAARSSSSRPLHLRTRREEEIGFFLARPQEERFDARDAIGRHTRETKSDQQAQVGWPT